jgi:hypothetical protein
LVGAFLHGFLEYGVLILLQLLLHPVRLLLHLKRMQLLLLHIVPGRFQLILQPLNPVLQLSFLRRMQLDPPFVLFLQLDAIVMVGDPLVHLFKQLLCLLVLHRYLLHLLTVFPVQLRLGLLVH